MSITGAEDGPPYKVGVALVDVLAGLHAAAAILAGLHGGEGARIEVPLLDSGLAGLVNVAQNALVTGAEPARYGNAHPNIVPYQDVRDRLGPDRGRRGQRRAVPRALRRARPRRAGRRRALRRQRRRASSTATS